MKIFCDMDGVLVNFLGGLHKALGLPYDYDHYPYTLGKWNMLTDMGGFKNFKLPFSIINGVCTADFWANLEWMHDGHDIWRAILERFDPKDIYLLTTPMPNTGSASGKMMWVEKHLPDFVDRTIITRAPKHLLADGGRLLIDDRDKNVTDWYAIGCGYPIPVPRPWNRAFDRRDTTLEAVTDWLDFAVGAA